MNRKLKIAAASFVMVVAGAVAGVGIGWARGDGDAVADAPAPFAVNGLVRGPQSQLHQFRSRFRDVQVAVGRQGRVRVAGAFQIGDSEGMPEVRIQEISVADVAGNVVASGELGRVPVAVGAHSGEFPFAVEYVLPPGKYSVTVISHVGNRSKIYPGGVVGKSVACHSKRTFVVK